MNKVVITKALRKCAADIKEILNLRAVGNSQVNDDTHAKLYVKLFKFSGLVHEFFEEYSASPPASNFLESYKVGSFDTEFRAEWPVATSVNGSLVSWSQFSVNYPFSRSAKSGALAKPCEENISALAKKLENDMGKWIELTGVFDSDHSESLPERASRVLLKILPDGRESNVIRAMMDANITSPAGRKTQGEILKLALGHDNVNDNKRVFRRLKTLGVIETGDNKRGFFLNQLGCLVAQHLKKK